MVSFTGNLLTRRRRGKDGGGGNSAWRNWEKRLTVAADRIVADQMAGISATATHPSLRITNVLTPTVNILHGETFSVIRIKQIVRKVWILRVVLTDPIKRTNAHIPLIPDIGGGHGVGRGESNLRHRGIGPSLARLSCGCGSQFSEIRNAGGHAEPLLRTDAMA